MNKKWFVEFRSGGKHTGEAERPGRPIEVSIPRYGVGKSKIKRNARVWKPNVYHKAKMFQFRMIIG